MRVVRSSTDPLRRGAFAQDAAIGSAARTPREHAVVSWCDYRGAAAYGEHWFCVAQGSQVAYSVAAESPSSASLSFRSENLVLGEEA